MLIVGLGNPGPTYEKTRHNVGFMVIDELISRLNPQQISSNSFKGEVYKTKNHFLLKPHTFMNLSGESVAKVKHFYKIEDVVVIHDDLDLPFGSVRFKVGGGNGGHNGLKSVDAMVSKNYARVRIGIGKPKHKGEVISFVLNPFDAVESECLEKIIAHCADAVEFLFDHKFEDTSSMYSKKGSLC